VVVSTLMEAWQVVKSGLVSEGVVTDVRLPTNCSHWKAEEIKILYGLPVARNKISDLSRLHDEIAPFQGTVRLLVDHLEQIKALEEFESTREARKQWSVFIKCDGGQK